MAHRVSYPPPLTYQSCLVSIAPGGTELTVIRCESAGWRAAGGRPRGARGVGRGREQAAERGWGPERKERGGSAPGTRRTPALRRSVARWAWARDPPANRETRRSAVKATGRGGGEAWEGRTFGRSAAGRSGWAGEGLPGIGPGLRVERSPPERNSQGGPTRRGRRPLRSWLAVPPGTPVCCAGGQLLRVPFYLSHIPGA